MRLRTALTLVWPVLSGTLGGCSDSGSADGESADGMAMSPAAGSASADSAASAGSAASDVGGGAPAGTPSGGSSGDSAGSASSPDDTDSEPAAPSETSGAGTVGVSDGDVTGPAVSETEDGIDAPGEPETASTDAENPPASGETDDTDVTQGDESEATGTTSSGGTPMPSDGCPAGEWPEVDPSTAGPFEVATDNDVGPEAGEAEDDGTIPRFTMFRPDNMEESGLCHPVITWGNGTGSTPNLYGGLLRHLASHGFVVIGSNSTNVARGEPRPMNVGIDWVIEQNEDPSSVLYQRIDTAHIGATGHSQGAIATTQASSDERIVTSLPIQGAGVQRDLHGPAMFFCGGQDDIVSCDGAIRALDAVDTLPAMYANYLSVDHGSWLSFGGNSRTDVEVAITAWMRVHLMADQALRSWFYGASCGLCTNDAWEIDRKNMDE